MLLGLMLLKEAKTLSALQQQESVPTLSRTLNVYDYEYERNGTSNVFMMFAPLESWRKVKVTEQRTMVDWAGCMRELVDIHFPEAEKIILFETRSERLAKAA